MFFFFFFRGRWHFLLKWSLLERYVRFQGKSLWSATIQWIRLYRVLRKATSQQSTTYMHVSSNISPIQKNLVANHHLYCILTLKTEGCLNHELLRIVKFTLALCLFIPRFFSCSIRAAPQAHVDVVPPSSAHRCVSNLNDLELPREPHMRCMSSPLDPPKLDLLKHQPDTQWGGPLTCWHFLYP